MNDKEKNIDLLEELKKAILEKSVQEMLFNHCEMIKDWTNLVRLMLNKIDGLDPISLANKMRIITISLDGVNKYWEYIEFFTSLQCIIEN